MTKPSSSLARLKPWPCFRAHSATPLQSVAVGPPEIQRLIAFSMGWTLGLESRELARPLTQQHQGAAPMIEVYSWATPNGHKVHIMLEECGLPYRVIPVDIGAGDQFKPEFLAISPNNKIPAIIDPDGPEGKPYP